MPVAQECNQNASVLIYVLPMYFSHALTGLASRASNVHRFTYVPFVGRSRSTRDLRRHFDGPVAILPRALAAGLSTEFPESCSPMERGRDRKFADSPLEGSGFELPVPREIALWSKSGLALHLGSLALRRRGPDWNGRPTAEAWVSHREEIPRPHPSALTASPRSDVFGLGASLPTCRPAPTPAEKPGRCRRASTGDIERILRQA
jgi:hypothetical protein